MNDELLKSAWQSAAAPQQSPEALQNMLTEGKHPVLKRIRKQLLTEGLCFMAFLVAYYDFFDGDRKPAYANALLITGVVLILLHNLWGYLLTRKRLNTENVTVTLQHHVRGVRKWAVASVICRLAAIVCILLFFTSVITFTTTKWWLLAGAAFVALIQLVLLGMLWMNRIKTLQSAINGLI